jgi:alkyl hydroperoxide reductase subunit AhpC
MAGIQPEFANRNAKILGISVDPVESHSKSGPTTSRLRPGIG